LTIIERQKATRRLRQAKKVHEKDPSIENQRLVETYTLDLYYTTHFPLTEKYIALYPKSQIETQQVLDKRDRIRKALQEEMLHGKKKSSGSNALELGSRMSKKQESNNELESDEDDMHNEGEESEEDEFLDLGHKRR
jgi:rRNA-processing protein Efg1